MLLSSVISVYLLGTLGPVLLKRGDFYVLDAGVNQRLHSVHHGFMQECILLRVERQLNNLEHMCYFSTHSGSSQLLYPYPWRPHILLWTP